MMKFFKKLICVCVVFLCALPRGHAYEQKSYNLENFLSNRLSLAHFVPTANTQNNTIQKIGWEIEDIPYTQQLFWENILLLSFFTPEKLTEWLFPDRYFVTHPSGKVESISFSQNTIFSSGHILQNTKIQLKIPLSQQGEYGISIFDMYGFSVLDARYQFWKKLSSWNKTQKKRGVIEQINFLRSTLWESKLQEDALLQKIANKKIDDMFAKKYFWHEDVNGNSAIKNISNKQKVMLWENLARWPEKDLLQQKLEDSGAHRYNMQFSEWNKVGIAIRKWPDNLWYMVQIFSK